MKKCYQSGITKSEVNKMKNTNLQKKNSFAKILRMKLADNSEKVIIFLVIFFSIMFVGYPFVFKQIPNKYVLFNFGLVIFIIFIIIPLFNLIISEINSLKRIQYIPLNENEIKSEHLDTIKEYVAFINELIAYDNFLFGCYRAKCPEKIISQVIEFGNTYYSNTGKLKYCYMEKYFDVEIFTIAKKVGKNNGNK